MLDVLSVQLAAGLQCLEQRGQGMHVGEEPPLIGMRGCDLLPDKADIEADKDPSFPAILILEELWARRKGPG
jgi:hypothetical protein